MLEGMSAAEYAYWQAFFSIEPFPQQRADLRVAEQLRASLFAAGIKRVPEASDLMPDWWGERTDGQSPEQMQMQMNTVLAGRKRKKKP